MLFQILCELHFHCHHFSCKLSRQPCIPSFAVWTCALSFNAGSSCASKLPSSLPKLLSSSFKWSKTRPSFQLWMLFLCRRASNIQKYWDSKVIPRITDRPIEFGQYSIYYSTYPLKSNLTVIRNSMKFCFWYLLLSVTAPILIYV